MKKELIKKITGKSILLGIVLVLNSILVSAAINIIGTIDSMISSGNLFQIFMGRVLITALLSLPLIIIQMYAKDTWGKFAVNAFSVVYVVVAFYASSLVKNLTVASWIAWGATLLAGFMAMKKTKKDSWDYSSDIKLNPLTIGLMIGIISMFVAPFNSLITGTFFPGLTGAAGLLKAVFRSPLMWPILGIGFGFLSTFVSSRTAKSSDVEKEWEDSFSKTQDRVEKDIDIMDSAIKTNNDETELTKGIAEGLDRIEDELDKEQPNNAGIAGETNRIKQETEQLGKLQSTDIAVSAPSIANMNHLTETILKHDQKMIKIAIDALKSNTDPSKKSGIEKSEDYLTKLIKTISEEKDSGFWNEYKKMEEDNFKELTESFEQVDIRIMHYFSRLLKKNTSKYKNISKFLKFLTACKYELDKQKHEMKEVVKPAAKKMIEKKNSIMHNISELQKDLDEVEKRKRALTSHEKTYAEYKKQILDYIRLIADTKYSVEQRKKTEKALKQRIDIMKTIAEHKNLELKEIKGLVLSIKKSIRSLAEKIKSADKERKIILSLLEDEIGADKTKKLGELVYFNQKEEKGIDRKRPVKINEKNSIKIPV